MNYSAGFRQPPARRCGPRRLALLRRRQQPGRDRAKARRVAADGAAAGVAVGQRGADQGPARPPDRALHGAGRGAQVALCARPCRGRALRPAVAVDHHRHRGSRRRRDRAAAAAADPIVMAIGTGRTLKAAIEQLTPMECPQHKIVSLTGSIAPDGSAAFYNVIFNIADMVKARSFPMPLPVIASSAEGARAAAQPADDPGNASPSPRAPTSPSSALATSAPMRRSFSTASSPGRAAGAAEGRGRRRDRRLGLSTPTAG